MSRCRFLLVLFALGGWFWFLTSPGIAGDCRGCAASRAGNGTAAGGAPATPPPIPRVISQFGPDSSAKHSPGVPTFRYGYFGAKEHASFTAFSGYYHDYKQCGWWRGN